MTAPTTARRRGLLLLMSVFAFVAALAAPKVALAATPKFGVKDVSISRTKARAGQTVTYKVKNKKAAYMDMYIACKNQVLYKEGTKKGNTFTFKFKVLKGMAPGTWRVSVIEAFSKKLEHFSLENKAIYTDTSEFSYLKRANLNKLNFKVTGTKRDTEAPKATPSTLKLGKGKTATVKSGKNFSVSVKATDALSEVTGMQLFLVDEEGYASSTYWTENTSKSTTKFAGKATVYGKGTYKLLAIILSDTFGNNVAYLDKTLKDQTDPSGEKYSQRFSNCKAVRTADFSKYRVTVKK